MMSLLVFTGVKKWLNPNTESGHSEQELDPVSMFHVVADTHKTFVLCWLLIVL